MEATQKILTSFVRQPRKLFENEQMGTERTDIALVRQTNMLYLTPLMYRPKENGFLVYCGNLNKV